jgi:hypothetical protein
MMLAMKQIKIYFKENLQDLIKVQQSTKSTRKANLYFCFKCFYVFWFGFKIYLYLYLQKLSILLFIPSLT